MYIPYKLSTKVRNIGLKSLFQQISENISKKVFKNQKKKSKEAMHGGSKFLASPTFHAFPAWKSRRKQKNSFKIKEQSIN